MRSVKHFIPSPPCMMDWRVGGSGPDFHELSWAGSKLEKCRLIHWLYPGLTCSCQFLCAEKSAVNTYFYILYDVIFWFIWRFYIDIKYPMKMHILFPGHSDCPHQNLDLFQVSHATVPSCHQVVGDITTLLRSPGDFTKIQWLGATRK